MKDCDVTWANIVISNLLQLKQICNDVDANMYNVYDNHMLTQSKSANNVNI